MSERTLTRLTEVSERAQKWVWTGRIPAGAITDLAGDPGRAKSRIVYDLAARVTRGRPLPGETAARPPAGVVLLQAEDDAAATVEPVLQAADADPDRVFVYDPAAFGDAPLRLPADLKLVRTAVQQVGAKLVVVDPATALIACNPNADRSVRDALRPLAELAAEYELAVVVVRHLHKSGGGSLLHRGAGSIARVAAARSGLLATADPASADPHRHLLVQTKTNLAGGATWAYRTVLSGGQVVAEWLGEVAVTARDLAGGGDAEASKRREAAEVLYLILAEGPCRARDVRVQAAESCVAFRTLERAKAALGVVSERKTLSAKWWEWVWRLPGEDTPLLAQVRAK
ncbi:AAA family ATPase [Gemmata sp.]|uniref:AAA family ATPase n=1 Tax=Gemmata sp. TaxID=1914242 RepID=UPI003F72A43C